MSATVDGLGGLGPRELAEIVEFGEAQTMVELVEALDPDVADR